MAIIYIYYDDNDSDIGFNNVIQSTSKKKRKQASTVIYVVDTGSQDSAGTEFQPETINGSGRNKRKFVQDDNETPEDPYHGAFTTVPLDHTSGLDADLKVRKKRKTISNSLQPDSHPTYSAWGDLSTSNLAYRDAFTPNRQPLSSLGRSGQPMDSNHRVILQDSVRGHGMYPPRLKYAQPKAAESFKQDMSMHANLRFPFSNSRYTHRMGDSSDLSYEEQSYLGTSSLSLEAQHHPPTFHHDNSQARPRDVMQAKKDLAQRTSSGLDGVQQNPYSLQPVSEGVNLSHRGYQEDAHNLDRQASSNLAFQLEIHHVFMQSCCLLLTLGRFAYFCFKHVFEAGIWGSSVSQVSWCSLTK